MIHAIETEADRKSLIHRITGTVVFAALYLSALVGLQAFLAV